MARPYAPCTAANAASSTEKPAIDLVSVRVNSASSHDAASRGVSMACSGVPVADAFACAARGGRFASARRLYGWRAQVPRAVLRSLADRDARVDQWIKRPLHRFFAHPLRFKIPE